ncbi:MAG: DeoR/GlpR family DNA-binding transcription regulator [Tissierellia bacterium]|nr:DeoR/GlpR family DNA-binding transcription regulator [Tissierellia bacterium]
MFPVERQKYILEEIKNHGFVKVDDLSKELGVSSMTIHRDLDLLEKKRKLRKKYGGAVRINELLNETASSKRRTENTKIKKKIAYKALELINHGDVILLDGGSTNFELAKLINDKEHLNLTVITNDLNIAVTLCPNTKVRLIMIGGVVDGNNELTSGSLANSFLDNFSIDKSFIGTQAINEEMYIMTTQEKKITLKKKYLERSAQNILVTDKTKFGEDRLFKITQIKDFDYLITDAKLNKELKKYCVHNSVKLLTID